MSSLEKRHTGQRGSMQGHHKYSDGFSDTSSSGSFMDDTDREVSNLTDRAFRSLCIGEEAIYNDSEFSSSPTERHKAFAEVTQQRTVSQETFSYGIQQYGETEAQPEMASTFQHSYVDVTHQEQAFREGSLSYLNNGSREVMWQQGRSSSRVSSLIKAFSSGECYRESGTCDAILARDRHKDFGSESWDKSALLSMQRELSEFSSGYHQNFNSGNFQSYRNHFYTSDMATAMAQMDTTVLMKTSKNKFTNCFFHSEFSPFQLWEDYNRFPFESSNMSGFMSASEFPRWYDSPMYKELKDNQRIPNSECESRRFNQRQIQDIVASQRSRSMVIQKASAIEKRCESEMASNYPPWKKNHNFVRNKLPGNRPSTVSPTNERTFRPDSNLFNNTKVTHEILVENTLPSSVTPFNITQLLTPVIHTRQETETSEILQFAHTPSVSDYSSQGEIDPKLQCEVKHLRDSYKSKASSLLFNLKDNRKRVKSTYSPTRFKGLEITDRNKQPSKLEGRESRFSDILISQEMAQENLTGTDAWASSNLIREPSAANITLKDYTDGFGSYDNLTLTSPQNQDGVANYKSFHESSEGHVPSTDPFGNVGLSTRNLSAQDRTFYATEGQLKDLHSTFSPARPEIANLHPKTYQPTHSLPAQTSEQYGQSDNVSQNDLQQRKGFGRKTFIEYSQTEAVIESCPWDQNGSLKEIDRRSESQPFRGEITALIAMDKQRKATAKQYSDNDNYFVRKETYMQKVNEDIKLGRLSKEEEKEFREDTISTSKTSNGDKSQHNNQMNTFSKHSESYIIPKNGLQNKTSPLKEAYDGLQSFSVKNELVKEVSQQNTSLNTMTTQQIFDQRAYAPLQDHKGQKNEGLYSYQPYKYEPNKQWHMASTSEDSHIKESIWTQKQSEMMGQTNAKSYKISNTSYIPQINPNEFSTRNGAPSKQLVVSVDTSDQNDTTKKEDKFSINDILAIRDHEQARRLKDNTFVLAKSENSQNQIKYDMADKQTITQPVKEQEQQGSKVHEVISPSPGYIRKDFHNTNETNVNNDRKDKIMSKDTDKVTTRVFSYKDKGQSKQEILTSKLKAHAQKEISAIKEKGLAKQGILARSATKASVNNDGQESHSVKKEITADKLNHLFQDITYSSVTQYKEQNNTQNDYPTVCSPPSMEKQTLNFEDNANSVVEKKGENVKYKLLTTERQNDKHPAEYKELKTEMFIQEEEGVVADMKNNAQNNYQPHRISEDQQKCATRSEEINNNKESAKQSHEMSPSELMSGNLAAAVKTENYTSHKKHALHDERQTIQHDQKKNVYGSNLSQHTYSEKLADTTKKDFLHVTSTETKKSNNGLNKKSQFELAGNTPGAKEVNVYDKSTITAAMDQSKNEPIKNSPGISQLTSSSSDMKFKNGIPSAKQPMEPAKSEFTSNLQTNTLSTDAEQVINRTYKNNSGVTSDSDASSKDFKARVNPVPKSNPTSQSAKEPETQKNLNENGQALIIKNKTKKNMAKQETNTSHIKAEESIIANQMVGSQSKSERNEELLTKESFQRKELHQDDKNTKTLLTFDKIELPRNTSTLNNSQQGEKRTETVNSKQDKEQAFTRPLGISHEKNNHMSTIESTVKQSSPEPGKPNKSDLKPNVPSQQQAIVDEGATRKNNTKSVLTENSELTAEISNITTFTPSKEETVEEPMIYSICVSSKSEDTLDDEPMIYSICVSSKCHIDEQQNSVKQEEEGSVESEKCIKDESFDIKNDRAETEDDDFHRQTELSSNTEEEDKFVKPEPQTTLDKSNAIEKITTSYEDLLVKYGLPVRDYSLTSKHKEEERKRKEKEEAETQLSQKPIKYEIKSPQEAKEKSSENTQTYLDDSRQTSDQQASFTSQPLKETESKIKQINVQPYDTSCSKNMAEKQQSTGNNAPKLCHSTTNAALIPDDTEDVKQQYQDEHNMEPSRQSRRNTILSKEKKVEDEVRNNEKVQSVKDNASFCRKSPEKTDHASLTTKQSAIDKSTRAAEVVKSPTSTSSMTKSTINTELTENKTLRRTIPQIEKKPEEIKGKDMRLTGKITDNGSICRKSPEKTDHASLTTKQSAMGESTRAAEVVKAPTSTASMAKSTANTELTENLISRRTIPQIEKKPEEIKVKNMMTEKNTDNVSICRKSPEKSDHASLTTKQSAVGESTRAAEVVKAPTSTASMAKATINTELTENQIPRRTVPQIEKKPEDIKVKHMTMTEKTTDNVSIRRKSPEKTDLASLTNKQSAMGESTRAAEVVKSPTSTASMAKATTNTEIDENKTLRRTIPQIEKKPEEIKGKDMRMTGKMTDNGSICRKSPEKTDHVYLTTKQSAMGESTRAAEVVKAPTSAASMTKATTNTELTENQIPRRTIPQIERKHEEIKGKDMRLTGKNTDNASICRKSPEKSDHASLTNKQSAMGESTRAAEVVKAPTSTGSMAKATTNTELTENQIPRRTKTQIEKKPEEIKVKHMTMTEKTTDNVSICKKTPEKTDHVSLTTKQSALGESTRAAEVAKLPTSTASMAKATTNTELTENQIPRRTIPQINKKPDEMKGTEIKMTGKITDDLSLCRKSPEKTDHVYMPTKWSAVGESTRAAEVLKAPTSNASTAKDTANTKPTENKIPRRTISQTEKKPEMVKGEDQMNHSNTIVPQKNELHGRETFNTKVQKTTHEAKQEDSIMALKPQPVSDKDVKTLQKNENRGLGDKRAQEKLQVDLNKSHEIANRMKMFSKDGCAAHVNNYKDKVSSIGEDVCTVVKQDQASFEAPKIHLRDIKVSTEEVSSNKEFIVGHKNQHEVIKRENQKGKKDTVVTEHVGEKYFTEQKKLPVETLATQKEPKTVNNMKESCESEPKHDNGKEITRLKKKSPNESEKAEMNPRQAGVCTQEIKVYDNKQPALNSDKRKKEESVLGVSEQNDGDLKVNENRSSLKEKKDRHVEATETKQVDQTNTNKYQPERSYVPKTKVSATQEKEHAQLSQQDTRKEDISSKSEATQRNKKIKRPEISAIADYARLKVISAENDTKDLDIFFYNSYDQSSVRTHEGSHGHVSDIGEESGREAISREKVRNLKRTTSPFKKPTDKDMLPQKHNPSTISAAEPKPLLLATSGSQEGAASTGTQARAITSQKESNTKQTIMEQPNKEESNKMYQSKNPQGAKPLPLQAEGTVSRSRQLTYDNITENARLSHSGGQESLAHLPMSGTIKPADNQINIASPTEEIEELQYYTVNVFDAELKPNKTPEPTPPSLKPSQNKDPPEKSEDEKKENSLFLQSLMDFGKVNASGPRSNSSSPAMGKPTMFRVKDNTMRASSVTKAVKPRFHRSFSDDFRIGSPKDHLSGSEKEDEINPKESTSSPVLHEPAIAAAQLHKVRETLNNTLSSAEYTTKQSKSHHRRSQNFEEEETHSLISTLSEDMEKCTARSTGVNDISLAFMPKIESYRDSYQRPASACYERPESVCYERPESACSDIRSMGKPPAVPPKSEKALRRAQRLTTRRMKKAETPKLPENLEQLESKSISNVSDVPSSPSDILSTHPEVQTSSPVSQYDIQPNYTSPAHSIVAQSFPVTQRKLLQDPNSGQYFMVDVPLPVKTKTFYDPETGKYVQLNVRQRSQGAPTQPASVEMLNAPYMLYRGFLPMTASSVPPMRSSSEMSTLAGLTVDQNTLEATSEQWRQNVHLENHSREPQQYPEVLYRSHEEIHNPALYAEDDVSNDGRHTDIITMSELEDFAMEST